MKIVIASAFRNSSGYIERYIGQLDKLWQNLHRRGDEMKALWVHGDSSDATQVMLEEAARWEESWHADLFEHSHGGPVYGSVDDTNRWRQIAKVWNALLPRIDEDADVFVLIESDLKWKPQALLAAIDNLGEKIDGCTGMVWGPGGLFYDTWGHRSGGTCFSPYIPYHPILDGEYLVPMDSGGSLWAVKAEFARKARFTDDLGIVGWCNQMRANGARLWLDPSIDIYHPSQAELAPKVLQSE